MKYRFEATKSNGKSALIEGRVAEGQIYVQVGDENETINIDIPVEMEDQREMIVSTHYIATIGQYICMQMDLGPDFLDRAIEIRRMIQEVGAGATAKPEGDLN